MSKLQVNSHSAELGSELEPVPATQKADGLDEGAELCVDDVPVSNNEEAEADVRLDSSLADTDSFGKDDVAGVPLSVVPLALEEEGSRLKREVLSPTSTTDGLSLLTSDDAEISVEVVTRIEEGINPV